MSNPSQRELIQRGHAWIESQLPEDEPDHVPDWVVVGLMRLGERLAREKALERAESAEQRIRDLEAALRSITLSGAERDANYAGMSAADIARQVLAARKEKPDVA